MILILLCNIKFECLFLIKYDIGTVIGIVNFGTTIWIKFRKYYLGGPFTVLLFIY